MGKLSRAKGASFERETANRLEMIDPSVKARRCLIETQQGNQGDIVTTLPLAIQCKVGAVPPIYDAIDQAVEAARGRADILPVAIIRRNATGTRARHDLTVLRTDDFLRLLRLVVDQHGQDFTTLPGYLDAFAPNPLS